MSAIETYDLRKDRFFPAELVLSANQLQSTLVSLAQNILFLRSINIAASSVMIPPRIPSDEAFVKVNTNNGVAANMLPMMSSSTNFLQQPAGSNGTSLSPSSQSNSASRFAGTTSSTALHHHHHHHHPVFELRFNEEGEAKNTSFVDSRSVESVTKEISQVLEAYNNNSSSNDNNNNNKINSISPSTLTSTPLRVLLQQIWKIKESHLEQLSLMMESSSSQDLVAIPCVAKLLIIKVAVEQKQSPLSQAHVANNYGDVVSVAATTTSPLVSLPGTSSTSSASWFGSIVSATAGAFAGAVSGVVAGQHTASGSTNSPASLGSSKYRTNDTFSSTDSACEVVEEWCVPIVVVNSVEVQKIERIIKRFKQMIGAGLLSSRSPSCSDDDGEKDDERRDRKRRAAFGTALDREDIVDHRNRREKPQRGASLPGNEGGPLLTQSTAAFAMSSSVSAGASTKRQGNQKQHQPARGDGGAAATSDDDDDDDDDDAVMISEEDIREAEREEEQEQQKRKQQQQQQQQFRGGSSSISEAQQQLSPSTNTRSGQQQQQQHPQRKPANSTSNSEKQQHLHHHLHHHQQQRGLLLPRDSLLVLASMLEPDSSARIQRVLLWMQEEVAKAANCLVAGPASSASSNSASTSASASNVASTAIFENASKVVVSLSLSGLGAKEGKLVEPMPSGRAAIEGKKSATATPGGSGAASAPPPTTATTSTNAAAVAAGGSGWSISRFWSS